MVKRSDLINWYKAGDSVAMRSETGLSPHYVFGFLNASTFEMGIVFLKTSFVNIIDECENH